MSENHIGVKTLVVERDSSLQLRMTKAAGIVKARTGEDARASTDC